LLPNPRFLIMRSLCKKSKMFGRNLINLSNKNQLYYHSSLKFTIFCHIIVWTSIYGKTYIMPFFSRRTQGKFYIIWLFVKSYEKKCRFFLEKEYYLFL
jgi:hypothetical protein